MEVDKITHAILATGVTQRSLIPSFSLSMNLLQKNGVLDRLT